MALTGLQVFKLLPNTNCKECGYPTCLAFAMKLAAGKESLDKCPDASDELKAALGAASAPPIRGVTIGSGTRAITIGEETVFFRHEKTFVRPTALLRVLDPRELSEAEVEARFDEWAGVQIERAGEVFKVDGVAVVERAGSAERSAHAAEAATERGLPLAVLSTTPKGARAVAEQVTQHRPLIVPPAGAAEADGGAYVELAAGLKAPLVVPGKNLDELAAAAAGAAKSGVEDILLEPPAAGPKELHQNLSRIRRGALDRIHPGLGYPVFVRVHHGQFEKGVIGITRFASVLAIEDHGGDTWLPYWTLRQNIYTDPQKPLQVDAGVYPIGEPDDRAPLLVTTNFSLTYFIVSTELDGTGMPCRLAVVDAEGMSVLTAWSAGKFGGEKIAKDLKTIGVLDQVSHKTLIIPGYVAVISGELEDALGGDWKVITGPQEASDIGPFLREVWTAP
jgi:acetyl-CoA decarbonylase/synthase complex subunit gamma